MDDYTKYDLLWANLHLWLWNTIVFAFKNILFVYSNGQLAGPIHILSSFLIKQTGLDIDNSNDLTNFLSRIA